MLASDDLVVMTRSGIVVATRIESVSQCVVYTPSRLLVMVISVMSLATNHGRAGIISYDVS